MYRFVSESVGGDVNYQEFVDKVEQNYIAPVAIKLVNPQVGYGVFAKVDIKKGDFIGEFTGEFKPKKERSTDIYYIDVSNSDEYVVDASFIGNEMRFLNDGGTQANCSAVEFIGKDKKIHNVLMAKEKIARGDQLTCKYHSAYWQTSRPYPFQVLHPSLPQALHNAMADTPAENRITFLS